MHAFKTKQNPQRLEKHSFESLSSLYLLINIFFSPPPLTTSDLCNICQTLESEVQKYVVKLSKVFVLAAALSIP